MARFLGLILGGWMMKMKSRFVFRLFMLAGALSLPACGGGSDGPGNPGASNRSPSATAGEAQTVDAGVTVTLAGSGADPDGTISGYAWSQTGGPDVTLGDADTDTATFEAPSVDAASELTFKLTVTDDEGATATDTVTVTVAPVIAMAGRVYDGPLAGATVSVTVGERTYTAVSDENGNYTVNVGSLDPDALITISAVGGEGEEHVELLSIAASFATLQTAAGEDGVLEDDESGTVDVTNLSTAKAVLMIEANGGEPITSEEQAVAAEKNVNGNEMIRLATVIKLVVDGGFDLPEGVESTLDLVDDTETSESFITAVNTADPAAFQETQDAMLADGELLGAYDAADVPSVYTLLIVDAFESTGASEYIFSRGQRYEFDSGGTGHVYTDNGDSSGPFTWAVVDGEIAMTFNPPLLGEGFCNVDGIAGQIRCDSETGKQYLRLVVDGVEGDQLMLRAEGETTYPEHPDLEQPVPFDDAGSVRMAFAASAEIDFTADEVPGIWAFAVAGAELSGLALSDVASGFLEFAADGTGVTQATAVSPALDFTWAITGDGALKIDFANGTALTARRLRNEGIGYDTQLLFETAAGDLFARAGVIVRKDGSIGDVTLDGVPAFYSLFDEHPYFTIVLQEGGSGLNRGYIDGVPDDIAIGWSLGENDVITMSYRWDIDAGAHVASCAGIANCHLYRQRVWIPVAYDEELDRVYVYERQQEFDYDPAQPENKGAMNFVQTSVRFWGVSDTSLDGDAVLGKTSAPATKMRRAPWVRPVFRQPPPEL